LTRYGICPRRDRRERTAYYWHGRLSRCGNSRTLQCLSIGDGLDLRSRRGVYHMSSYVGYATLDRNDTWRKCCCSHTANYDDNWFACPSGLTARLCLGSMALRQDQRRCTWLIRSRLGRLKLRIFRRRDRGCVRSLICSRLLGRFFRKIVRRCCHGCSQILSNSGLGSVLGNGRYWLIGWCATCLNRGGLSGLIIRLIRVGHRRRTCILTCSGLCRLI
jgi:hypothetical protein